MRDIEALIKGGTMAKIYGYLFFDGDCREAMTFYKGVFGGELQFTTVGDTPIADQMPASAKDAIMHASLVCDSLTLMASDNLEEGGVTRGNGLVLMLDCGSEEEIRALYAKLSDGATAVTPLADQFWGSIYGDLADRFGTKWMLSYDRPKA
jgi:PhnB protein